MHQKGQSARVSTALRRWASGFVCALLAFSVVVHLAQPVPAHAAMEPMPIAASSSHNSGPCDSGHDQSTVHCTMVSACSLYAPLEAAPIVFETSKLHVSLTDTPLQTGWAAAPQLQPPQISL